jgi:hypothetical protein
MICWRCHSNNVNTGSRLPICSDVKTRKRRSMVGIDMIRNNRISWHAYLWREQVLQYLEPYHDTVTWEGRKNWEIDMVPPTENESMHSWVETKHLGICSSYVAHIHFAKSTNEYFIVHGVRHSPNMLPNIVHDQDFSYYNLTVRNTGHLHPPSVDAVGSSVLWTQWTATLEYLLEHFYKISPLKRKSDIMISLDC